jgi:hypothetical protein
MPQKPGKVIFEVKCVQQLVFLLLRWMELLAPMLQLSLSQLPGKDKRVMTRLRPRHGRSKRVAASAPFDAALRVILRLPSPLWRLAKIGKHIYPRVFTRASAVRAGVVREHEFLD